MNMRPIRQLPLMAGLVLLLAACTPVQAPATASSRPRGGRKKKGRWPTAPPARPATRYYKETTVAAVSVGWQPAEEANCPADQPISACDIEPGQQNFTISIELIQIA